MRAVLEDPPRESGITRVLVSFLLVRMWRTRFSGSKSFRCTCGLTFRTADLSHHVLLAPTRPDASPL
jgi:hypothetical protein